MPHCHNNRERIVFAGLLALGMIACTDGGDGNNTRGHPPGQPSVSEIVVDFPPARARFPGQRIDVRGRVSGDLAATAMIEIDGGAGPVAATLNPDGSWLAEAVALPEENTASLRLSLVDGKGESVSREVSLLELGDATTAAQPLSITRSPIPGHIVLVYTGALLVEVDMQGVETNRYTVQAQDFITPASIQPIPASRELLVPVYQRGLAHGCVFMAVDLEQGSERELFKLDWEPDGSRTGNCNHLEMALHYDRIVIIDNFDDVVMTIDYQGNVLSRADNQVFATRGAGVFLTEESADTAYYLDFSWNGDNPLTSATEVHTFDVSSGQPINYFQGEPLEYWDQREARATGVEDGIYFIVDDTPGVVDLDPLRNRTEQASGYRAVGVTSVTGGAGRLALNLEETGRVSTFNTETGETAFLFDLSPYYTGTFSLSDYPADNGSLLLLQNHSQGHIACCSFGHSYPVTRSWRNLYLFEPQSQVMRQYYAAYSPATGLSAAGHPQDTHYSIEPASPGELPGLLQVSHEDGGRTRLDFTGLVWDEQHDFITGLGGEYIVVSGPGGITEYNIKTRQVARKLPAEALAGLSHEVFLKARMPGTDGEVYAVNNPVTVIYRVDFGRGELVPVSGAGAGEGPRLSLNPSQNRVLHWSAADNAVFIASSEDLEIWRIGLARGEREQLFFRRNNDSEYPPAISSMHYLLEKRTILAGGAGGLYVFDLETGTSVAVPVSVGN